MEAANWKRIQQSVFKQMSKEKNNNVMHDSMSQNELELVA